MKFLSVYFDKAVCCNLAERPDRRFFIEEQYRRLGFDRDFEFRTTVRHPVPVCETLEKGFVSAGYPEYGFLSSPGELCYAFEFYSVVRQAYLEGAESLLLMEDDICFLKDPYEICKYLDALPPDWDIIQGDYYSSVPEASRFVTGPEREWVRHPGYGFWNLGFTGFSRKGMKYVLSISENYLAAADYPVWCSVLYDDRINVYSSSRPIAVQTPRKDSDICSLNCELPNALHSGLDRSRYFSWNDIVTPEISGRVSEIEKMISEFRGFADVKQRL